ncbi:MAG: hypothetical protein Phog2KO_23590 [Phototrophicaceae bacterium]
MASKSQNASQSGYTAANITALTPREHIRRRPGMYVGGTDIRALHHLIYEVVDNSIDEALAGRCDRIMVTLHDDGSASVGDNGAGIPIDMHESGRSALEVVMTEVGAGGKFDNDAYKVSGGLHGVGVSAVNALAGELTATVYRDGHVWEQTYHEGLVAGPVEKIRKLEDGEPTGTSIRFIPDFTVMDENEFNYNTLAHRFREMAFVTGGVTLTLRDERVKPFAKEITYYFDGGIASFVKYLNRNRRPIHDVVFSDKNVDFEDKEGRPYSIGVEIAFQYSDAATTTELAFTNTINTPDGGTHITGMRSAITSVINRHAKKIGALKERDSNFSGNDTLEGLTAIVSVKHPDPQFESQTKVKLLNPEVQGAVSQVVSEALQEFMELNSREARKIIDKCMTSKRAREAAKKARELVRGGPSLLESSTLPGKLADCSQHGENAEIYIVEGDSAGGCFSGDTLVALADGRNLSFKDLVQEQADGKEHFIYTIRKDNTVGIEKALHARITKKDAPVIRLTLDSGEAITCTPDHKFMLRDGSYKEAKDLTSDDSIMPLYRKLSDTNEAGITIDGYEMVWSPRSDSWLFTHLIADSAKQHTNYPYKQDLNRNKTIAMLKNIEVEYGELDIKAYREQRIKTKDKSLLRFDTFCNRYFEGDEGLAREAVSNYNHRVVSIEYLSEEIDVYDIEVPNTHNFALASGVFVHNSAKQGRDRHFQAILPLRGKILNTERARLDRILDNNEIKSLISALGTGIHDDFTTEKLRYDRVIIMTDADVDGSHIRTLLLTFFFRHMLPLVQEGHLYIAQPPIYQLKQGKESRYIYPQAGMNDQEILDKSLKDFKNPARVGVQRYKGLGEMNPGQLWETTMDPETRTLLQVTIDDAAEADRVFDMLMGSSVPPRKRFIQTNAKRVKNLDV